MIGIYKIENMLNGKVYIGSSKDIKKRWAAHQSDLRLDKHHSSHLQYSFNKYGTEVFKFSLVLKCTLERMPYFENLYVGIYKSTERKYGYNMTTPHPVNGAPLNDSLETKEKIRRAVYKRHYNGTEEEYQQWKEEVKQEKERVKGLLHTNAKAVFQIDKETGTVINRFESVASTAKALGSNVEILRRAVTGKTKTHKGFVFVYESLYTPTQDYRVLSRAKVYVPKVRVPFKGRPITTTNVETEEVRNYDNITDLAIELDSRTKHIYKVMGKETRTYKGLRIKYSPTNS
ncbi:MAG: GIY-YIG nuclease family protein [Nanoarchaeota archaeon]|nr:GIY-YIG nuclease family protein [Nanoarchaeota archaeon]